MSEWSEKAVSFLQKGIVPILVLVGVCIAGGVGYQVWNKNRLAKIEKANDAFFLMQKEVSLKMQAIMPPPEAPEALKGKTPPKPKAKPSAEEMQNAFAPSVEKLQAFIKTNEGTQPAVEAALLVSELTSEYSKYEEGIKALQVATKDFDKKNFLFGVAGSELGSLLAKTDKCNEAAQEWEKVLSISEHEYLADQLRLKSGVCYQRLGMYDKAERLYNEVIKHGSENSNGRMAKKFLLYIKYVKSKASNEKGPDQKNG
jgi:predicted negative regulator of RcsB-dependent stress response